MYFFTCGLYIKGISLFSESKRLTYKRLSGFAIFKMGSSVITDEDVLTLTESASSKSYTNVCLGR